MNTIAIYYCIPKESAELFIRVCIDIFEKMSDDERKERSAEQTDRELHPWSSLSTVTTFDEGNSLMSTVCINNINESQTRGQIIQRMPSHISILVESLIQLLCATIEGDNTSRNKLYNVVCDKLHELKLLDGSHNVTEFEHLREQYQRAFHHCLMVARAITGNVIHRSFPLFQMTEWSRYHREFQEISSIAKGGFGEVFKAMHRLDCIEYAIKKIIVPPDRMEIIMQYIEEVKTLAKLNHVNIVPYKAAWMEPTLLLISHAPSTNKLYKKYSSDYRRKSKSSNFQFDETFKSNRSSLEHSDVNRQEFDNKASCTTERIVETTSIHEHIEEIDSDIVSFRDSGNNKPLDQSENNIDSTDDSSSPEASTSHQELCGYTSSIDKNKKYMTLYIQMALCEQTLEQWMHNRKNVAQPIVKSILQQLLCGIDYIHSQDVVHHDIKPSNIFVATSGQLHILLGDFGLACVKQTGNHHSAIGTHMYAAPEQLKGKCDPKSDIYSVGIVLTQLLIPTKTQMELSYIINCFKCGNTPEAFATEHKWAQLIKQLMHEDPVKRPWTKEILDDLNKDTVTSAELQNIIYDKDNKIKELKEEVALLKETIKKQSILLSQNI